VEGCHVDMRMDTHIGLHAERRVDHPTEAERVRVNGETT